MSYITMLSTIFNCGEHDINKLIELLEDFEVDFEDVWHEQDELPTFNMLIETIYRKALESECISTVLSDVNIVSNYSDSHLFIDGVQMYNLQNIKDYMLSSQCEDEDSE